MPRRTTPNFITELRCIGLSGLRDYFGEYNSEINDNSNQMMIVLILIIKFEPGTILLLSMTLATILTREIFTPIYLINIIVEMSVF